MLSQLPTFENARILVIGDLMLDRYWHGSSHRISPEAPVPVVNVSQIETRPGGAANVALNIAELGAQVTLMGITGQDDAEQELYTLLESQQVNCQFISDAKNPTITKLRIISQHQQLIRADFEASHPTQAALDSLRQGFLENISLFQVIIFSDYGKGCLTDIQDLLQAARVQGIPTIVDPKSSDFGRYAGATLITPNFQEFKAAISQPLKETHTQDHEREIEQAALTQIQQHNLNALLITRGAEGMSLVPAQQPALHLPTHAREVFDVTGAGDTVVAILGLCLACELSLPKAVELANTAAGIVVGKLGTATVHKEELLAAIYTDPASSATISLNTLLAKIKQAKLEGQKLVITNGCFDLLHPGHIEYLHAAKQLGDKLLVLVNDDNSVKELKGPTRPINPVTTRLTMLSALQSVDWVFAFSEATPDKLIAQLQPDILVKGGDYQIHEIAGADSVLDSGGEVKVLPFKEGFSSSQLIERIQAITDISEAALP